MFLTLDDKRTITDWKTHPWMNFNAIHLQNLRVSAGSFHHQTEGLAAVENAMPVFFFSNGFLSSPEQEQEKSFGS